MIEALFLGFRTLPFACSYAPGGSLRIQGAASLLAFIMVTNVLVTAEEAALASTRGTLWVLVDIAAIGFTLRVIDLWRRRPGGTIQFEALPESAPQSLGLSG